MLGAFFDITSADPSNSWSTCKRAKGHVGFACVVSCTVVHSVPILRVWPPQQHSTAHDPEPVDAHSTFNQFRLRTG
eukprot:1925324-Amphidinium_carterae.2